MRAMKHEHSASARTTGRFSECCDCGGIRLRKPDGTYNAWHVCDLCRIILTRLEDVAELVLDTATIETPPELIDRARAALGRKV
jgi:hypothetical protein